MSPETKPPKYATLEHIAVSESEFRNWQLTVDILAQIAGIPAALIMRCHQEEIEVVVSSQGAGHVYPPGRRESLATGLYCETVLRTQRALLVANAAEDPAWSQNPDMKLGLISYYGLPLNWPGGEVFGTLCILDRQQNAYSPLVRALLERFRDCVEFSLSRIYGASSADAALRESEHHISRQHTLLDAVINSAGDIMIFSLDRQYCYTAFNEKHRREMRAVWQTDIQLGRSLLDCMSDLRLRALARLSIDRALGGESFTEIQHQTGPGTCYEFIWNPIRRKDGSVEGLTAFIRDVTVRQRGEDELRKSRSMLAQAEKLAQIGSWEWEVATDTVKWSDELFRLFGLAPADTAPPFAEHSQCYHPEDRQRLNAAIAATIAHGTPFEVEVRVTRHDGEQRIYLARGNANHAPGSAPYLVGSFQDITVQKRTEEALRQNEQEHRLLIQNLHSGVVVHAADTQILFANEQGARLLGLSVDQMEGKLAGDPVWSFVREDGTIMPVAEYPVNRVVATGQPQLDMIVGINRPPALKRRWVLVNAFPEFGDQGQLRKIVVTFADITERMEMEIRAAEQLAELRRWQKAMLGRENRVLEAKREVNTLLARLGEPPRYGSVAEVGATAPTSHAPAHRAPLPTAP